MDCTPPDAVQYKASLQFPHASAVPLVSELVFLCTWLFKPRHLNILAMVYNLMIVLCSLLFSYQHLLFRITDIAVLISTHFK